MKKTLSEYLFERFCKERGVPYARIPEGSQRTPDYELFPESRPVVVEVKEIKPNKEEMESERIMAERGWGNVLGHTPGDRVRSKIAASSAQIKARTQGKHPSLLVVFDERGEIPNVEPYSIRVAMYGLEQINIAVPPPGLGSPHATGMSYGPKRKMTRTHNTSISAVAAMVALSSDRSELLVCHNRHAKIPLPPKRLAPFGVRQFRLADPVPGRTADWVEIRQEPINTRRSGPFQRAAYLLARYSNAAWQTRLIIALGSALLLAVITGLITAFLRGG